MSKEARAEANRASMACVRRMAATAAKSTSCTGTASRTSSSGTSGQPSGPISMAPTLALTSSPRNATAGTAPSSAAQGDQRPRVPDRTAGLRLAHAARVSALACVELIHGRCRALTSLACLTPSTPCLGPSLLVCVKMNHRILIGAPRAAIFNVHPQGVWGVEESRGTQFHLSPTFTSRFGKRLQEFGTMGGNRSMRPRPRRADAFWGACSQRRGCESICSVDSIVASVVRHDSRSVSPPVPGPGSLR